MAEIVKLPKLSDTMTEGTIAKWHKEVGDQVASGELLVEIETDKATMEFESFQDGILLYKGVEEGKSAPVDAVLAIFGEKGEKFEHLMKETEAVNEPKQETEKKNTNTSKENKTIDVSSINAVIVKMPKLSDTMTEGTLAKWHKKVGEQVTSGTLLAEIETDKATMEFEAYDEGILLYQGVQEQQSAPVDSVLAIIGEKGADYQKLIEAAEQETPDQVENTPTETITSPTPVVETAASPKVVTEKRTEVTTTGNGRIKASPLAKRLAQEKNISLNLVKGTGDGGRIIKRDIEGFNPATGGPTSPGLTRESFQETEVSQMRKTIAKRLSESKFSAPHFYLTISIDMDNAMQSRKAIIESYDSKISFNDFVIKAAAIALTKHPKVNSSWLGNKIRTNEHVNIGVAVAVEEGLLVPVVRYANTKSLFQINGEVKEYAQKARDKKLQPQDWEGNTFTISNLGMFGIEEFTAIINPPDACIMAVGGISQVPVVKNGEIVPGNIMKVTLSCDHRVVDGATGAAFLNTFKQYMEHPITMFV